MRITVNGKSQTLTEQMTVLQLLQHLDIGERKIAVEVNRCIIPATQHHDTVLAEGDCIEIIEAVGGG